MELQALLVLLFLLTAETQLLLPKPRELFNTNNYLIDIPVPNNSSSIQIRHCTLPPNDLIVCTGDIIVTPDVNINGFMLSMHQNGTEVSTQRIGDSRIQDATQCISTSSHVLCTGCANSVNDESIDFVIFRSNNDTSSWDILRFGSSNNTEVGQTLTSLSDGSTILGIKSISNGTESAVVVRYDNNGDITQASIISDQGQLRSYISSVESDKADTTIAVQYFFHNPDHSSIIHRFDNPLELKWSKKIVSDRFSAVDATQAVYDGSGYLLLGKGKPQGDQDQDATICKIDKNGSVIWSKQYKKQGNINQIWYSASVTSNGDILVSGFYYYSILSGTVSYPIYARLNGTNGDIIWTRQLNRSGLLITSIFELKDGTIFISGYNSYQSLVARVSADGWLEDGSTQQNQQFFASDVSTTLIDVVTTLTDKTSEIEVKPYNPTQISITLFPVPPLEDDPANPVAFTSSTGLQTWLIIIISISVGVAIAVVVTIIVCKTKNRRNRVQINPEGPEDGNQRRKGPYRDNSIDKFRG